MRFEFFFSRAFIPLRYLAALTICLLAGVALAQGGASTSGVIGANGTNGVNDQHIEVSARPASELFTRPQRQAPASVLAKNQSRVSAQLSALVTFVGADAGMRIKAGDVLLRLDDADVRLSMAQAVAQRDGLRARLQLARRQLKRLRELKTNNFVSTEAVNQRDAEMVSLRAELQGADAQVAVVARQLEKCVIRAPFDAVVANRAAQLGELTSPGSPLFTLVQLGGEEISANVSLGDAAHLQNVSDFQLQVGARSVQVKLLRLSPVVSSQTRTREARFAFAGDTIPTGSEGRIVWPDSRTHLPPHVLVRRDGKLGLFTIDSRKGDTGNAKLIIIDGAQEGRPAAVDIDGSVQVITSGQAGLQPGTALRLSKPASAN